MLRVDIYDKAFAWKAPLGDLTKLTVVRKHNEISVATLTLPANHKRLALLAEPGARVRIRYNGDTELTGPVRERKGDGPTPNGERVFEVQSDFRILHNFLGWPVPTSTIDNQTASEYYTVTGPAETVVKDVVAKNIVPRAPYPVTVAADQARGSSLTATFRMHPLYDRLFPAVDAAGIGVTVVQDGAGLTVDAYVPAIYPHKLTDSSRIVRKWSFSGSAPTGTAGVVGGQGDGTARVFKSFVDSTRESDWGDRIEVFQDARDTASGDIYTARAQEVLADTAPVGTVEVELAEAGNFRYGGPKGIHVGDIVTVVVGGETVTDVVREVTLEWSRADGKRISATVGPKDDPMQTILQAITALARGLRRQEVSL